MYYLGLILLTAKGNEYQRSCLSKCFVTEEERGPPQSTMLQRVVLFLRVVEGPWVAEPREVLAADGRSQAGKPHLTSPHMILFDTKYDKYQVRTMLFRIQYTHKSLRDLVKMQIQIQWAKVGWEGSRYCMSNKLPEEANIAGLWIAFEWQGFEGSIPTGTNQLCSVPGPQIAFPNFAEYSRKPSSYLAGTESLQLLKTKLEHIPHHRGKTAASVFDTDTHMFNM